MAQQLREIFRTIRTSYGRSQDILAGSPQERAIKEALRNNDNDENAMDVAFDYGGWYQTHKINPLKEKLRPHYNNIVQGRDEGQTHVFHHAREKFVTRLTELLPDWNVPGLNLTGEDENNVVARRTLVQQLSAAIPNANGEERDRLAHALSMKR